MFEYHGWATLQDTLDHIDGAADGLSQAALDRVLEEITLLRVDGLQTADVRVANGSAHLWIAGLRNHKQDPVIEAYRRIAVEAPWSYGTLYVHDDEAPRDDSWVVWVMKRGLVSPAVDMFLSPHIGEVEDAYDT